MFDLPLWVTKSSRKEQKKIDELYMAQDDIYRLTADAVLPNGASVMDGIKLSEAPLPDTVLFVAKTKESLVIHYKDGTQLCLDTEDNLYKSVLES